jgi:hypothetical protein
MSETRTLQFPLALYIVTTPVAALTLHAVVVLVSYAKVPVKFGTAPTPRDLLELYVAVAALPYFREAEADTVKVSGALLTVTVRVSYAAR